MRRNLVKERRAIPLTQKEMALKLKITERHYQAIEAGTSKGSMALWEKAKCYFGQNIDYLAENIDNEIALARTLKTADAHR